MDNPFLQKDAAQEQADPSTVRVDYNPQVELKPRDYSALAEQNPELAHAFAHFDYPYNQDMGFKEHTGFVSDMWNNAINKSEQTDDDIRLGKLLSDKQMGADFSKEKQAELENIMQRRRGSTTNNGPDTDFGNYGVGEVGNALTSLASMGMIFGHQAKQAVVGIYKAGSQLQGFGQDRPLESPAEEAVKFAKNIYDATPYSTLRHMTFAQAYQSLPADMPDQDRLDHAATTATVVAGIFAAAEIYGGAMLAGKGVGKGVQWLAQKFSKEATLTAAEIAEQLAAKKAAAATADLASGAITKGNLFKGAAKTALEGTAVGTGTLTGVQYALQFSSELATAYNKGLSGSAAWEEAQSQMGSPKNMDEIASSFRANGLMSLTASLLAGFAPAINARANLQKVQRQNMVLGHMIENSRKAREAGLTEAQAKQVTTAVMGDKPTTLYIDTEQFDKVMIDNGIDPAKAAKDLTGSDTAYDSAKQGKTDLGVPCAEAVTLMGGRKNLFEGLKDHMTVEEGGETLAQAQKSHDEALLRASNDMKSVSVAEDLVGKINKERDNTKTIEEHLSDANKSIGLIGQTDPKAAAIAASSLLDQHQEEVNQRMVVLDAEQAAHQSVNVDVTGQIKEVQESLKKHRETMESGKDSDIPEAHRELQNSEMKYKELVKLQSETDRNFTDVTERLSSLSLGEEDLRSVAAGVPEDVRELSRKIFDNMHWSANERLDPIAARFIADRIAFTYKGWSRYIDDSNVTPEQLYKDVYHVDIKALTAAEASTKSVPIHSSWVAYFQASKTGEHFINFNEQTHKGGDAQPAVFGTHEIGHFYLHGLEVLSEKYGDKAIQLQRDLEILKDHFFDKQERATASFDIVKSPDKVATGRAHEAFAELFTLWNSTGKVPDAKLEGPFRRFRQWMRDTYPTTHSFARSRPAAIIADLVKRKDIIYKDQKAIGTKINDDVLSVFKHVWDGDNVRGDMAYESVRLADQGESDRPLFGASAVDSLLKMGFTEENAKRYGTIIDESNKQAQGKMEQGLVELQERQRSRMWKLQYRENASSLEDKLGTDPAFNDQRNLHRLQYNKTIDGTPLEGKLKKVQINEESFLKKFSKQELDALNEKGPKVTVKGKGKGMDIEEAARELGYDTAEEMMDKFNQLRPAREVIDRMATEQTVQQLGPMHTESETRELVRQSMQTDGKEKRMLFELKHLVSEEFRSAMGIMKKVVVRMPDTVQAKSMALDNLMNMKLSEMRTYKFDKAQRRAAKEASKALFEGRWDDAAQAKKDELMSYVYYKQGVQLDKEVNRAVAYVTKMKRESTQRRLGKAGSLIQEHMNILMNMLGVDNGYLTEVAKERRIPWDEFESKVFADTGMPISIPDEVKQIKDGTDIKDLTVKQLMAVRDTVQNLSELASKENRFLGMEKHETLEKTAQDIASSIESYHKVSPPDIDTNSRPSGIPALKQGAAKFLAVHTRMEFLFEQLDGYQANGATWQALYKPFVEAAAAESKMNRVYTKKLKEIFSAYSKNELGEMYSKKTWIPEVGKNMTKNEILAVALNQGTEYNKKVMVGGQRGWTQEQVNAILDRLDKRDWDVVQGVWNMVDEFWDPSRELHRRLTGIEAKKEAATQVVTKHGVYEGGYYPLKYDTKQGYWNRNMEKSSMVDDLFGYSGALASTQQGRLKTRTSNAGLPIMLDLSVLSNHVNEVVHDLTHREAVIDAWRLSNHETFQNAVTGSVGRAMYDEIQPWIKAVAGDFRRDVKDPVTDIISHFRHGASLAILGGNVGTFMVHLNGYAFSMAELGPTYFGIGMKDVFSHGNPIETYKWVAEQSEFMKTRLESGYDREIKDFMQRHGITDQNAGAILKVPGMNKHVMQGFMQFLGYGHMLVDLPAWLGAYRKAMDGAVENIKGGAHEEAVAFADRTVRMTQGTGNKMDVARIQRGSELLKMFTMFMSFYAVQANQLARIVGHSVMDPKFMIKGGVYALACWFIPAAVDDMLRGRFAEDGENEKEFYKRLAKYPFQGIVGVRDVYDSIERSVERGEISIRNPALDMVASAGQALATPFEAALRDKPLTKKEVRASVMGVAATLHIPAALQIWRTGEVIADAIHNPSNYNGAGEVAYRALMGKNPKVKQ